MLHETQANRQNQSFITQRIQQVLGWKPSAPFPTYSVIDQLFVVPEENATPAFNGKTHQFVEAKTRNNAKDTYPTYTIDLAKIEAGQTVSRLFDSGFIIAVKFTDNIYLAEIAPDEKFETSVQPGRRDRVDPYDEDIVAHIPLNRFLPLPDPMLGLPSSTGPVGTLGPPTSTGQPCFTAPSSTQTPG